MSPEPSEPPAEAEVSRSPATLRLLLRPGRDRELLADLLGERYRIELADDDERPLEGDYDGAVLDLRALDRVGDGITAAKAADGAFLPVVLLVGERDRRTLPPDRRAAVDDVITMPASREGIRRRIENLLARRRTALELRRQNERLETFASVVSHDLRNPLSVAEGRVQLALEAGGAEADLEAAQRALERMGELIEDLLTLAREGTDPAAFEWVALDELAEASWAGVRADEASLAVEADGELRGHPSRVRQLLENLFRNAIEHGGATVTVTVGDLEDGFFVEDDGVGIPAGMHEALFEHGYTTGEGGTGLGLAIAEEIARRHGWSVSATDAASGGARFEFVGVERRDG